jgi:ABC-type branched-subunit amino acid transport system ATPase component
MNVSASNLHAGYGSATIIDGLDLNVRDGEAYAIVGRNGMGKTTLVKALLGYLPETHGTVQIGGHDTSGWPTHRIIRLGIGYAPQEENLFSELTVGENLDFGHMRGNVRRTGPGPSAGRPAGSDTLREEVLSHFPVLGTRLRQHAGTLSGGEQKMLVLARTLVVRPSLVILDEISDGLQPAMVSRVQALLTEIRRQHNVTIIMVEQNLDLALAVADRVAVMKRGDLVHETAADSPTAHQELVQELAP